MRISEILIKPPFNFDHSSSLSSIIKGFKETGLDMLPVVDRDERLLGVINLEDIAKIFEPYSGPMLSFIKTLPFLNDFVEKDFSINQVNPEMFNLFIAEDIMDTNFITLSEDTDLEKAYSLMMIQKVKIACVVSEGRLVGMVRLLDIIINLFQEKGII